MGFTGGIYITQPILCNIAQCLSSLLSINQTLLRQTRDEHTLTSSRTCVTRIHAPDHLISDERAEGISLVIKLIEGVFPEDVEDCWCDEEAADGHPEPVCEGGERKGDHEDGEDGGDEDDEGFCGKEVEVQDKEVVEEGDWAGAEVD